MKKRWASYTITVLIVSILMSMFILPASAVYNDDVTAPEFTSNVVYVESLDYGTVIFNKNSNVRVPMASLTKITTALVVLENCENLDDKITVQQSSIDIIAGTDSSTAGIKAGEILTVRQLLNLLLIRSANEAACILADYIAGSNAAFVDMMNEYVTNLGCKDTHYINCHGLDGDEHYTTAEDLAIIIKQALKNETFVEIDSQAQYTLAATNLREEITYSTTNLLMVKNSGYYYEYCSGIITGSTSKAGYCLASTAEKNGCKYLCIILGGKSVGSNAANGAFKETVSAYNWVFSNIKRSKVVEKATVVDVVDVSLAKKTDHVRLIPSEEVFALVPSSTDISSEILIETVEGSIPNDIKAPIKAGDVLGKANVTYKGEILATIDLVAAEDISRGFFASIGYYLGKFLTSTFMKIIYVLLVTFILIILGMRSYNKKRRAASKTRVVHKSNHYKAKPGTDYSKNYKRTNYKRK